MGGDGQILLFTRLRLYLLCHGNGGKQGKYRQQDKPQAQVKRSENMLHDGKPSMTGSGAVQSALARWCRLRNKDAREDYHGAV
ncbi:hypothetical protein GCM10023219_04020 [Stakelama sediminis]